MVCWHLASLQFQSWPLMFHSKGQTARSHQDGLRPHRCAETALRPAIAPSNGSHQPLATEGSFLGWKKEAMQLKQACLRRAALHPMSQRRPFWWLLWPSLPMSSSMFALSLAAFPSIFAQLLAQWWSPPAAKRESWEPMLVLASASLFSFSTTTSCWGTLTFKRRVGRKGLFTFSLL